MPRKPKIATLVLAAAAALLGGPSAEAAVTDVYFSDRGEGTIRRVAPDGVGGTSIVVSGLNDPRGLYFDNVNNKIVWTDLGNDEIRRADPDGSNNVQLVSGVANPLGVTVDPTGQTMYWAEFSPDRVSRINADGSGIATTILNAATVGGDGVDVAIDPASGLLYTSASPNRIVVSNQDGSDAALLRTTPGGAPFLRGLAIDEQAAKIYWVDKDRGVIERSNLDGTTTETVLSGIGDTRRIAIDPVGGKIYWASRTTDALHRADLVDGGNAEIIASGLNDPWGVTLRTNAVNAEAPLPLRNGTLVIDHRVNNDPTFESPAWTLTDGPGNTAAAAGSEVIGGQTYRYWSTADNSTSSGGFINYTADLTPQELLGSWRASARVRVVDGNGAAIVFHVDDGQDRWAMWLMEDTVQSRNFAGTFYDLVEMDTTLDYNLYEMLYTPVTAGEIDPDDLVTFFINGVEVGSTTRAFTRDRTGPDFPPMIRWGSGSSGGTGTANWNYVAFATIPEPASLGMLGALAAVGLGRRRRAPRR